MKSAELRQRYLDFFAERGHQIVPSSPLVPANDPTLLFANSGMVQFKDTFLGFEPRPYTRATTAQKCMRVAGKHNDLEAVGPSPRHHTFFEMMGNFSFGDYFKRDAIRFAWDFITHELKLPVERLWFSVYTDDDEAAALWEEVGADPARILRFGEKDNFWSMGDTGPCGPNSEIHYYQGDDPDNQTPDGVNSDDDDYMEFWNLVFMQYDRDANGTLTPLPRPSIDTGLGFERVAAILQGVRNNYETDLFQPIVRRVIELVGKGEDDYAAHCAAYHAIADHSRACAFLIADGVRPGNEGRNYVLRRILRRAAYLGQTLGLAEPFLAQTAAVVIAEMGDAYPELRAKDEYIRRVIAAEEERFRRTLVRGLDQLESVVARMGREGQTVMNGADAFRLQDTYGFPLDLTAKILNERDLGVDEGGFAREMEAQRQRSQQATREQRAGGSGAWNQYNLPPTVFTGYHETQTFCRVLQIVADNTAVDDVTEGDRVQIVFDQTCLYGESGGQVGDTGTFTGPRGTVRILDTQKPLPNVYVHQGVVERGMVSVGDAGEIAVDVLRRRDIMRNHTATHLLHRALRDVLGEHAEQAGSLVAPDRLRFDFGHPQAVTPDELREVERRVNAWVRADTEVSPAEMRRADAERLGATALFGEKYGDVVRVVTVGCTEGDAPSSDGEDCTHIHARPSYCSRELCGGTHVDRTGEIGFFRIVGESSVGSGLRRIEALTGRGADEYVEAQAAQLRDLANRAGVGVAQLGDRINQLFAQVKQQQAEIAQLQRGRSAATLDQLMEERKDASGVPYVAASVEAASADALRELGDRVRDKLRSGVVVLGTVVADKPQIVAMVTPDLVGQGYHAGKLVKSLATVVGGGGGGRPDVAQAGGRDAAKLGDALARVGTLLEEQGR
jgi:alanyl-tRNA synthetase